MNNFWIRTKNERVVEAWATATRAYHDHPSVVRQVLLDNAVHELESRLADVGPFVVDDHLFYLDPRTGKGLVTDLRSPYLSRTPAELIAQAREEWAAEI